MPTNALTSTFLRAVTNCGLQAPWNLLTKNCAYEDPKHRHPLRKGTMPTTVKLYFPVINAIWNYANPNVLSFDRPFRLIKKSALQATGTVTQYVVEMGMPDDTSLVVTATKESVRISSCEIDASGALVASPILPFDKVGGEGLSAVILALIPHIMELDAAKGNNKLINAIDEIGRIQDTSSWTSKNDIPDIVKDALYMTDIVHSIIKNDLSPEFGDSSSSVAESINWAAVPGNCFSGALVTEKLIGGWEPKFVKANGNVARVSSKKMTIADAKAKYAHYSAHRNWTPAEQMLIPQFPDTMPVMPETIRIADRICNTRNDVNPVSNIMWRGVTSYGKSTGIKQLAAILNMPLLILTCHPGMEITEFMSTFVPATEESVELNMDLVTMRENPDEDQQNLSPWFEEAVAYVAALPEETRKEVMDPGSFFTMALMDTETASQMLIGKEGVEISTEELCVLFSQIMTELEKQPLRKKLASYKAAGNEEKKNEKPAFVHVVSNYVKALVNGYLVEIQEASRIRDSGVLVGLNEYDRAGALIKMMNGASARRHKDAICAITDNVGYASCRPIDPSVIRRQDMIIDSYELTREQLLERVKLNTGCTDTVTLDLAYNLWDTVKSHCEHNSITEGSVSPMELERFVQAVMYDGPDSITTNLNDCIISKATSSIEDQKDIRAACAAVCSAVAA